MKFSLVMIHKGDKKDERKYFYFWGELFDMSQFCRVLIGESLSFDGVCEVMGFDI